MTVSRPLPKVAPLPVRVAVVVTGLLAATDPFSPFCLLVSPVLCFRLIGRASFTGRPACSLCGIVLCCYCARLRLTCFSFVGNSPDSLSPHVWGICFVCALCFVGWLMFAVCAIKSTTLYSLLVPTTLYPLRPERYRNVFILLELSSVLFTVIFLLFISLLLIMYFTCFGNVNICFPCQ